MNFCTRCRLFINMKVIILCLLIAAAQASDWSKLQQLAKHPKNVYKTPEGRIVGGEVATHGQFPYQAAVVMDGISLCGGSLITDSVVFTAAICVVGTASFEIHLGAQEIFDVNEEGRVIMTSTDGLIYSDSTTTDEFITVDLAIIRLPSPVMSSQYIAPIRMPSRSMEEDTYAGVTARASGWGYTSDAINEISSSLRFVDLPIMSNDDCQAFWPPGVLTDDKMCVDTSSGKSVCLHDNGGPMVITEDDGEVTQIAMMTSGSSAGCEIGYPALLFRVNKYLDWIEQNAEVTIRP